MIYPETLAQQAKTLSEVGVEVKVLGVPEMKKLGMGALLGVGQGSERESKLVVMRWNGADDAKAKPIAFVGKGVTLRHRRHFHQAGRRHGRHEMGYGRIRRGDRRDARLGARKAKVNAVGVVGLVENMPSGTAQRPGDIVTSMSGQTIEVLNTDAEGLARAGRRALVHPRRISSRSRSSISRP